MKEVLIPANEHFAGAVISAAKELHIMDLVNAEKIKTKYVSDRSSWTVERIIEEIRFVRKSVLPKL